MKTYDTRGVIFDFYKTSPNDRLVWSHNHYSIWVGYINDISRGFLISISDTINIIRFQEFENVNSRVMYKLESPKSQILDTLKKLEDEACYGKFTKFLDICANIKSKYKDTTYIYLSMIGGQIDCCFSSQFPGRPNILDYYLISLNLTTTRYYEVVRLTRLSKAIKHNTTLDYCSSRLQGKGYRMYCIG